MKKLTLLFIAILLAFTIGCMTVPKNRKEEQQAAIVTYGYNTNGAKIQVIEIDQCQYIFVQEAITHKANCSNPFHKPVRY